MEEKAEKTDSEEIEKIHSDFENPDSVQSELLEPEIDNDNNSDDLWVPLVVDYGWINCYTTFPILKILQFENLDLLNNALILNNILDNCTNISFLNAV